MTPEHSKKKRISELAKELFTAGLGWGHTSLGTPQLNVVPAETAIKLAAAYIEAIDHYLEDRP